MKALLKPLLFSLFLIFCMAFAQVSLADSPLDSPPPPPGGGHGGGGNTQGAPIDGGLGILLVLGAGYGARKLYKTWKEEVKE